MAAHYPRSVRAVQRWLSRRRYVNGQASGPRCRARAGVDRAASRRRSARRAPFSARSSIRLRRRAARRLGHGHQPGRPVWCRRATADAAGNFEILALPIGAYSVTVTMTGFKTWHAGADRPDRRRAQPRVAGPRRRQHLRASLGRRRAPLLQTERSSVQTVVQMEQIRELPFSTRNPVVLVNLVPGMRFTGSGGPERGSTVQGFGMRGNQTEFQLDGLNANAAMDEGGITIPNVDTIARVQRRDLELQRRERPQPAAGRDGHQVRARNTFHGTAWEFNQTRQVQRQERLRRWRSRPSCAATSTVPPAAGRSYATGRFSSAASRPPRSARESLQLGRAVRPAMLQGDFSGLIARRSAIRSPASRFPETSFQRIAFRAPRSSFSRTSCTPNSPDGHFRAVAPVTNDTYQYTARVDHQITNGQRVYARLVDEQEHQRLARLLARRSLGGRDDAAQHRRELHQHADARRCCSP